MAEKRTVYLTSETLALVRPGESLSGRLNDVCQRYAALRASLPDVIADIDDSGKYLRHTWRELEACRKAIKD